MPIMRFLNLPLSSPQRLGHFFVEFPAPAAACLEPGAGVIILPEPTIDDDLACLVVEPLALLVALRLL